MSRLWLSDRAEAVIRNEARLRRIVETGGPIFGYLAAYGSDTIVELAFGPGPRARHRPRSLIPDQIATQTAITEVHDKSRGASSYLGEWHTHPGGPALPSLRDTLSVRAIAEDPGVDFSAAVMLIVPTAVLRRRVRVKDPAAFRWCAAAGETVALDLRRYCSRPENDDRRSTSH